MSSKISTKEKSSEANKEKSSEANKKRILIITLIVLVVLAVLGVIIYVIIRFTVLNKNKEGFKESNINNNNTVEVNGHYVDCTPEIEYMNEFIKTSKGLS